MANISTMAQVTYAVTPTDLINGYCAVPILWDAPFNDTNYNISWSINDIGQNFYSLDYAVGDVHKKTAAGFVAVVDLPAAAPIVQGQSDFMNVSVGKGYSFTPLIPGVFAITIVATAVAPQGVFPPALLNVDVGYTDNAGAEYDDAIIEISDNLQPGSTLTPIFALAGDPITIYSSFVTFGMAGSVVASPSNVIGVYVGTIAYGATITQATSGATATFYGIFNVQGNPVTMVYKKLSGTDLSHLGYAWGDGLGNSFTPPNNATVQTGTFTGLGLTMTQAVTGAFGPEMAVPTTVLYVGPHISGVPDIPSGNVEVPGTPPSLTNAYAWVETGTNGYGGVFIPSAAWTDAATRVTYPYNLHIRIVQMPNNAVIPAVGSLITVEAMASHR
jgi:hypothetical protein